MKEATQNGARLSRCAQVIALSSRTLKRWQHDLDGPARGDQRPTAKRPPKANQLTPKERQEIIDTCLSSRFASSPPAQIVATLLGDNGSPLKAATILGLMHQLEIAASHSRPRVSNDNAFSESLFRTTKYHPDYPPQGFDSLSEAQAWAQRFVTYYNTEHKHRSLNFVTPDQKHLSQDIALLKNRSNLLEKARAKNPARWIKNKIRNCEPTGHVNLYPIDNRSLEKHQKTAA